MYRRKGLCASRWWGPSFKFGAGRIFSRNHWSKLEMFDVTKTEEDDPEFERVYHLLGTCAHSGTGLQRKWLRTDYIWFFIFRRPRQTTSRKISVWPSSNVCHADRRSITGCDVPRSDHDWVSYYDRERAAGVVWLSTISYLVGIYTIKRPWSCLCMICELFLPIVVLVCVSPRLELILTAVIPG